MHLLIFATAGLGLFACLGLWLSPLIYAHMTFHEPITRQEARREMDLKDWLMCHFLLIVWLLIGSICIYVIIQTVMILTTVGH